MNNRITELLAKAGFRIFGKKVVAGDFGSSGNATLCSAEFANQLANEIMAISDQVCEELKLESDGIPGHKTLMNLYRITLRNRIDEQLGITYEHNS